MKKCVSTWYADQLTLFLKINLPQSEHMCHTGMSHSNRPVIRAKKKKKKSKKQYRNFKRWLSTNKCCSNCKSDFLAFLTSGHNYCQISIFCTLQYEKQCSTHKIFYNDVVQTENLDIQDSHAAKKRSKDTERLSPTEASCFINTLSMTCKQCIKAFWETIN